jgi:hypothetical protein
MAGAANPYHVDGFTRALVTDVATGGAGGAHGIRFVGFGNATQATFTFQCNGPGSSTRTKTITRWVSTFDSGTCPDCTQPLPPGSTTVHLVK